MLHLSSLAIISVTGIIFQKDPCRLVGYFSWGKSWNSNSTLASVRNFVIFSSVFGEGNGIPLQYSCLENPMEGGAWWAAVHGVTKSQRRLSDFTFSFHFHALEKEMATHSSVLAWRIPGTGEPSGLPSMGSHRVGHEWSDAAAAAAQSLLLYRVLSLLKSLWCHYTILCCVKRGTPMFGQFYSLTRVFGLLPGRSFVTPKVRWL